MAAEGDNISAGEFPAEMKPCFGMLRRVLSMIEPPAAIGVIREERAMDNDESMPCALGIFKELLDLVIIGMVEINHDKSVISDIEIEGCLCNLLS